MKTFAKKTLQAALLSAMGVQAAHAGFTISGMGGQYMFDGEMNIDANPYYSGGIGWQTDGPVGYELSYLLAPSEYEFFDMDVDSEKIQADMLYHFNHGGGFEPYFLVGVANQTLVREGSDDWDSTVLDAGIGFKAYLTNGLSFRTEARLGNDIDEEQTSYTVGLGLNYEFGRKSKKAEEEPMEMTPTDSDSDGVADSSDLCPGTPAGKTVDVNGCVMMMDADKDGVSDDVDACPDTSAGAAVDAQGCYVVITETKEVNLRVIFATNSTEVDPAYYGEIEEVAEFMNEYPLTEVVIEGHTDDSGPAEYNLKLSQQRAEAVAKVLTETYGIDESRVSAKGYGEEQPLFFNDTPANRAKNRRVTAKVTAKVDTIQQ